MKKFFLCLALIYFSNAIAASTPDATTNPEDIFAVPKTYAVQNRKYVLGNQLTGELGYMPMDSFTKGVVLGASYTTYFTDFTGWEMINANYIIGIDTGLKNQLLNEFGADPGLIPDFPQWMVTSNIIYTPIYNKNLLFNKNIVWGDISFVAGGGVADYKRNKIKPLVDCGAVLRFFVSELSSVKVDFRENLPFLSEGIKPFLMIGVAYTYQLGASHKKPGEVDDLDQDFAK
jgi:outer membrane beta-barrel protein